MKRFLLLLCLVWGMKAFAAMPEVTLQDIEGKEVNVGAIGTDGKPAVISFFATWCKPCMQEIAALDELYPDWQDETGVTIYLVSIDQGQDMLKVKPLVYGNGWEFNVLLDPNETLKRAMNVQTVPHIFVLDGKGNVVYQHTGYTPGDEEEIRNAMGNW